MIGMAAGMALSGLRPVTYTIAPFTTYRCLEQIRVDLCYQNAPVIVAAVARGWLMRQMAARTIPARTSPSSALAEHDRRLPGRRPRSPSGTSGGSQARRAMLSSARKKGEPVVHHGPPPEFTIGKGIVLGQGDDICLLSTGNTLPLAAEVAKELRAGGLSVELVSFHTVKPLDVELLSKAFARCRVVATIEEHNRNAGLGGSVAEWLTEQGPLKARLIRIGMADEFLHEAGEQEHAREHYGLTVESIVRRLGILPELPPLAPPSKGWEIFSPPLRRGSQGVIELLGPALSQCL